MHKNLLWLTFLGSIIVVTLWFCGIAALELYKYSMLKNQAPVKTIFWTVKTIDEDLYHPHAEYSYLVKEKEYKTEETVKNLYYRNKSAAEEGVENLNQKQWEVWYDPKYPSYSSLDKSFPLKETLSAGVLIGVTLYFLGLGYYVGHRFSQR